MKVQTFAEYARFLSSLAQDFIEDGEKFNHLVNVENS